MAQVCKASGFSRGHCTDACNECCDRDSSRADGRIGAGDMMMLDGDDQLNFISPEMCQQIITSIQTKPSMRIDQIACTAAQFGCQPSHLTTRPSPNVSSCSLVNCAVQ